MKLNIKNVVYSGLAFLSISSFWQLYDNIIPLMLEDSFGFKAWLSGVIMALDNVLALFLLPFFGRLSDTHQGKHGRRFPFIAVGSGFAIIFMLLIPLANSMQSLPFFMIVLGATLLSMSIYRSPAVALMPDITPRLLRSKANAIINLMGTIGGMITLAILLIFKDSQYFFSFLSVALVMLLAIIILKIKIDENNLRINEEEIIEDRHNHHDLSKKKKISFGFILITIFFCFMGYNAVTTTFSRYATNIFQMDSFAAPLLIANLAALISFIPIGIISSKIGRKKTVITGIILLFIAFLLASQIGNVKYGFLPLENVEIFMNIALCLAGIAWATINVNTYPMVVEMTKTANAGKYTGYYYSASMSAQVLTPILSGFLIDIFNYDILFIYASACIFVAFITINFVHHGDVSQD